MITKLPPTVARLGALLGPITLALLAACGTPAPPPASNIPALPEIGSGLQVQTGLQLRRHAVATANPHASEAGHAMLKAGGSAVDAAIAAQLVLALVEPQSSGLGGGAFLLSWDGKTLSAWDGRETAPAASDEGLFLQPDGKPMPWRSAVVGGRSVGVPGLLRMLELAHRKEGVLPWVRLFEPAIGLAERGFAVSPRLHTLLKHEQALRQDPQAGRYFYQTDGQPWPVGHVLKNPALAAVLRAVAQQGSEAFYRGAVAADMVARVRGHASNPGRLTEADLLAYIPLRREALCAPWQPRPEKALRVCGFGPPSSGQLVLMQLLGLMGQLPAPSASPGLNDDAWLHHYLQASRLAYADRDMYIGDPAFVPAPGGDWQRLLAPDYLRQRAALIGPRDMGQASAGQPAPLQQAFAPQAAQEEHGTSHISVVDAQGRAVAMTTTIEDAFGSRLMSDGGSGLAGGFLLNNQLTDFAWVPTDAQGRKVANRVQPGKRPRSSMSPTLVFDARSGQLLMTLGSPGGPAIPHFTAKTLLGTQAWGLNAQQAIDLPNFVNFNSPSMLEQGRFSPATVQALKERGHRVVETELTSGLQAIERNAQGWFGGADPRREGTVRGD